MNTLTAQQRLEAYQYALDRFETGVAKFLCTTLSNYVTSTLDCSPPSDTELKKLFPEFFNRKPKNALYTWFNDDDEVNYMMRVMLLDDCVKELTK